MAKIIWGASRKSFFFPFFVQIFWNIYSFGKTSHNAFSFRIHKAALAIKHNRMNPPPLYFRFNTAEYFDKLTNKKYLPEFYPNFARIIKVAFYGGGGGGRHGIRILPICNITHIQSNLVVCVCVCVCVCEKQCVSQCCVCVCVCVIKQCVCVCVVQYECIVIMHAISSSNVFIHNLEQNRG